MDYQSLDILVDAFLKLAKKGKKWKKMPKGWTPKSRKSYWETITGKTEHPVTKCIDEMEDKIKDPGAFCASLKDRVEGMGWRKKKKSKKKSKKKGKKKS